MGRKQLVVLEALSKARKPMSLQDLADKNLKGDGRDEVYGASDLRSTFRRLGGRGLITVTEEEREFGKGDDKTTRKVQVASITDEGKKALKDAKNPPEKKAKTKDKAGDGDAGDGDTADASGDAGDGDAAVV